MGDHHDGGAVFVELPEELEDAVGGFAVQVAGGLVREDDLRAVEQGAGDGDALLLAAGELMRHLMGLCRHAHVLEDFRNAGVDGVAVLQAGGAEDEFQVRFHAAVHQELEILENHAQLAAQHRYVFCTESAEVEPADGAFSLGEPVLRRHRPDDGGLARTDFADDVHEVAREDGHVEAVDDGAVSAQDVGAGELDDGFHAFLV